MGAWPAVTIYGMWSVGTEINKRPEVTRMMREMVFIDAGGALYRGFGRCWPELVWDAAAGEWGTCCLPSPQGWDWGGLVTRREAERCYPGSTTAPVPPGIPLTADLSGPDLIRFRPELFDDYDGPIYRKSADELEEEEAHWRAQLKAWGRQDLLDRLPAQPPKLK